MEKGRRVVGFLGFALCLWLAAGLGGCSPSRIGGGDPGEGRGGVELREGRGEGQRPREGRGHRRDRRGDGEARGAPQASERGAPGSAVGRGEGGAAGGTVVGGRRLPFSDPERVDEIGRTLALINNNNNNSSRGAARLATERGGPFPHRQDGAVFGNREGRLPPRPYGYYHEYTVRTPGAPTRGARRLVMGEQGECYYTDDHYRTFIALPAVGEAPPGAGGRDGGARGGDGSRTRR